MDCGITFDAVGTWWLFIGFTSVMRRIHFINIEVNHISSIIGLLGPHLIKLLIIFIANVAKWTICVKLYQFKIVQFSVL